MSTVDQFESVFKAAAKSTYLHKISVMSKVLVATDLEGAEANYFLQATKKFLAEAAPEAVWQLLESSDFNGSRDLLGKVEEIHPDLIVTYRHLDSESWRWPYGLGECLDVLTQSTPNPILVLPHPENKDTAESLSEPPHEVMAVSGHLQDDYQLVRLAIHFTAAQGRLTLSHVEDQTTFDRYLDAISKIPEIETDIAKEFILERLLNDARDFAESVRLEVENRNLELDVKGLVKVGKRLSDYSEMIEEGKIDLLVMNAKDEDQMAMHGMAYPLAVELRSTPLLLL
ncbi:MAG: hypothetical protein CMI31_15670 [Opitutae bacterium]|nr:hypothetical protein [Opitutae bacterium]|tara:strand:+ start:298 stop:1152 length:855 start_codon:yes stop_codon:yes gene_type:complete